MLRSFAAFGSDFHDLSRLTDMGASLTSADESALQQVLEELSVPARCFPLLTLHLLLSQDKKGRVTLCP